MSSLLAKIIKTPVATEPRQSSAGRSVHIRQVDPGSCNGCELEINALNGPHYDLEQYGLHFVASPGTPIAC